MPTQPPSARLRFGVRPLHVARLRAAAVCWLEIAGADADAPKVAWGGEAFHAPCGNLWFNLDALQHERVPSVTPPSVPALAPASPAAAAADDDDDGFGAFAAA